MTDTYRDADHLLTAVFEVFGAGVKVVQWGDVYEQWEVTRVEQAPVTVEVRKVKPSPDRGMEQLWSADPTNASTHER